jgi:hypothetical protein
MVIVAMLLTVTLNPAAGATNKPRYATVFVHENPSKVQNLADQYEDVAKERAYQESLGADKGMLSDLDKELQVLQRKLLGAGAVRLNVPIRLYRNIQKVKNAALSRMRNNRLGCRVCRVGTDNRGRLVFEDSLAGIGSAIADDAAKQTKQRRRSGAGDEEGFYKKYYEPTPPPPGPRRKGPFGQ